MKTVKIKFVGVCPGFEPDWMDLYKILKKHYDVQIVEDDPDYIICDAFEPYYDYCGYPQVRIMVNGENYIPDFNLVDYAISRYPISFQDRNFYLPGCVFPREHWLALSSRSREDYDLEFVKSKPYFANFIASHESEHNIRGDFFKKLCEYKRVESPGSYLNNMPDGSAVRWNNSSKTDFQRKCKFTLCFESTSHNGFITEKITDAFYAGTIPVYYGSPSVTEIFNREAFLNCGDFESFDAVIDKIRELDQDDEKYLEMLRRPVLVDPDYPQRVLDDMERFVCAIFDQPLDKAYRRSRVYMPKWYDEFLEQAVAKNKGRLKSRIKRLLSGK